MTGSSYLRRRPCWHKCEGGGKCACDNDPQHPHTQHVCGDPLCVCHSAAAYGLVPDRKRGVYVRLVEVRDEYDPR